MASLGSVLVDQTSIGIIEVDHIMIKLQFYANASPKHFGGGGVHARGVRKPMLHIALSYTFLQFYANASIKHFGGGGVHARGVQKPMLDIALSYTFPIPHVPT